MKPRKATALPAMTLAEYGRHLRIQQLEPQPPPTPQAALSTNDLPPVGPALPTGSYAPSRARALLAAIQKREPPSAPAAAFVSDGLASSPARLASKESRIHGDPSNAPGLPRFKRLSTLTPAEESTLPRSECPPCTAGHIWRCLRVFETTADLAGLPRGQKRLRCTTEDT
jgi:hypothetical protein